MRSLALRTQLILSAACALEIVLIARAVVVILGGDLLLTFYTGLGVTVPALQKASRISLRAYEVAASISRAVDAFGNWSEVVLDRLLFVFLDKLRIEEAFDRVEIDFLLAHFWPTI